MDFVKDFLFEDKEIAVNIQEDDAGPLFQASQIGKVLGLSNIRVAIQDFDETEKCIREIDGPCGGKLQATFLTEVGLYRLLCSSRKPIAKAFYKWVAKNTRTACQKEQHDRVVHLQEALATAYFTLESERDAFQAALASQRETHERAMRKEREAKEDALAELDFLQSNTYVHTSEGMSCLYWSGNNPDAVIHK